MVIYQRLVYNGTYPFYIRNKNVYNVRSRPSISSLSLFIIINPNSSRRFRSEGTYFWMTDPTYLDDGSTRTRHRTKSRYNLVRGQVTHLFSCVSLEDEPQVRSDTSSV